MSVREDGKLNNGAVFIGVCRGKLSEGISLSDDGCRCVIMIGIPYPSCFEPEVILKRHYMDTQN